MDTLVSSKQICLKRAVEVRPRQSRRPETSPRKPRAQEVRRRKPRSVEVSPRGPRRRQTQPCKPETTPRRITPGKILPKPGSVRMAELRHNQKTSASYLYFQNEVDMRAWAPGRCIFFHSITNYGRISQLDIEFEGTLRRENNWPTPLPHMPDVYGDFVDSIHGLAHNIVCASCGVREHDPTRFVNVACDNTLLEVLSISEDTYIPYDYSCGVDSIDQRHIMIDKSGLSEDESHIVLCNHCHNKILKGKRPAAVTCQLSLGRSRDR